MALKVWMPLNGNLRNLGASVLTATNYGATVNANGKIGPCYQFNNTNITLSPTAEFNNSFSSEGTLALWIKLNSNHNSYALILTYGTAGTSWNNIIFGIDINNSGIPIFNCSTGNAYTNCSLGINIKDNSWHHLAATYLSNQLKIYLDGVLKNTVTTTNIPNWASCSVIAIGGNSGEKLVNNDCLNDIRIYNHCLSAAEVKKIAKGLVLHYKLDNYSKETTENLFKGTMFRPEDISNWPDNGSTDWTKPVRRYNGSTSIYNIDSGECTVTLNAAANLGICFARLASDINLRSLVKYTISCEAKCSKSGASLAIGLSYYNTSNGWVWRGGANAVAFKATNTWQTFTLSFYPDSDTQAIDYCFTVVGDANGTNTFTIRHCRMEEGSIATPWYPEDNISTQMTKVIDSSGYNNNAESNGYRIVNLSAGGIRYSKVAQFTTGARITTPMASNTFLPTDAITVNIWCKTPDVSLRFLSCTEGGGWNFEVSGGVLTFPIYIESVGYQICSFTTTLSTMNNNQWHMYTATYDRSQIKVYFDGVLDNTLTVSTGNPIWYLTYTPLCLGTEGRSISDQVAGTFVGALSDLRIYCTPLSDDDIKELYYMGMKIDKGLNIYTYEFKEISNSDIKLYKTGILQNIEFNETTTAAFKKTKKITASLFIEE